MNYANQLKQAPLMIATYIGNLEIAKILIHAGAKLHDMARKKKKLSVAFATQCTKTTKCKFNHLDRKIICFFSM